MPMLKAYIIAVYSLQIYFRNMKKQILNMKFNINFYDDFSVNEKADIRIEYIRHFDIFLNFNV